MKGLWQRFRSRQDQQATLLTVINRQQVMLAELATALHKQGESILADQKAQRRAVEIGFAAFAEAQVLREVLAAVMAHLARNLKPHPDPSRQLALFFATANKIVDGVSAAQGGSPGSERYQHALRELREAAGTQLL